MYNVVAGRVCNVVAGRVYNAVACRIYNAVTGRVYNVAGRLMAVVCGRHGLIAGVREGDSTRSSSLLWHFVWSYSSHCGLWLWTCRRGGR